MLLVIKINFACIIIDQYLYWLTGYVIPITDMVKISILAANILIAKLLALYGTVTYIIYVYFNQLLKCTYIHMYIHVYLLKDEMVFKVSMRSQFLLMRAYCSACLPHIYIL